MSEKTVQITVELSEEEAWQWAQFCKRSSWDMFRVCATSDEEAETMVCAEAKIRRALAEKGYAPR